MSEKTPFCFAIPLRSRAASKNWQKVQDQLSATLRSVLAQTDREFMVLVACHDVPTIPELSDPRVTVLKALTPPPTTSEGMMEDKGHKRRMMAVEFARRGGGYFMLTDADDLVSKRLVHEAQFYADSNGYILKSGFVYDSAENKIEPHSDFDGYCGTCAIFKFDVTDLPQSMDDKTSRRHDQYRYHTEFESLSVRYGRPLKPLPFPAAIYMRSTGENHSQRDHQGGLQSRAKALTKRLLRAVIKKNTPTDYHRNEFQL